MPAKSDPNKKPKLTDEERHARFVDMAHEVEASEDVQDFDKAVEKVTGKKPR
jgi:hypothetical protein